MDKQEDYLFGNRHERSGGNNFNSNPNNYHVNRNRYHNRKWSFADKFSPYNSYTGSNYNQFDRYTQPINRYGGRKKWKRKHDSRTDPPPPPPPPPVEGSEEYTQKKIMETSASIMRQLLSPDEPVHVEKENRNSDKNNAETINSTKEVPTPTRVIESKKRTRNNEIRTQSQTTSSPKVPRTECSVDEMRAMIMNHICNLNDGRRKNLINSSNSGYDAVIQDFNKQKRLEISRALRDICLDTSEYSESSDLINSIIPDMGIKIEDMPKEFVKELSKTVELSFLDFGTSGEISNVSSNLSQIDNAASSVVPIEIKEEPLDVDQLSKEVETAIENQVVEDFPTLLNQDTKEDTSIECDSALLINNKEKIFVNEVSKTNAQISNLIVKLTPFDAYKESGLNNPFRKALDRMPSKSTCEKEGNSGNQEKNQLHSADAKGPASTVAKLGPENNDATDKNMNVPSLDASQLSSKQQPELESENLARTNSISTSESPNSPSNQADENDCDSRVAPDPDEMLIKQIIGEPAKTLNEAVEQMIRIDNFCAKLTLYRQNLFVNLIGGGDVVNSFNFNTGTSLLSDKQLLNGGQHKIGIEIKDRDKEAACLQPKNNSDLDFLLKSPINEDRVAPERLEDTEDSGTEVTDEILESDELPQIQEKILVLKELDNELLAATESGKIFVYNIKPFKICRVIEITSVPITSLVLDKENVGLTNVYVGCFENVLFVYDYFGGKISKEIPLVDHVTCMEKSWGYIFIGTKMGRIIRYSIKKQEVEFEDKLYCNVIQVVKPTLEGARKVLIIGSSDSSLCVKDAMNGLYLREFTSPAGVFVVRCLTLLNSYLYCGTNSDTYMYYFNNGNMKYIFHISNGRGANCIEIKGRLLFVGCGNGSVYVYRVPENRYLGTLKGPGGSILSMKVLDRQVVIGTQLLKLQSLPIPARMRKQAGGK